MPQTPPQSMIAGEQRRAVAQASAGRPRHPIGEGRTLQDEADRLVGLMQMAESCPTHANLERIVAAVEEFASRACRLRQHYRGPSSRPCRPPLAVSADGRTMAW